MIRDEATMIRVLDLLCTNPSPTKAARAIGASDKLLWTWGTQSAAKAAQNVPIEESGFAVHWPDPDAPPVWFHEAFLQAGRIFLSLASMEHSALIGPDSGNTRVARDGSGRIQFKVDLKVASDAMTMSDFDWELYYGEGGPGSINGHARARTDIFERDADGCLIADTYVEPLPAQLRIHLLRSLLPSQFNPTDKSTSEVHHSGGVLVVGERKAERPSSPLRDDLESRLAAIRAKGPAHPRPNAPVQVFGRGQGDPPEHVNNGAGDDVRPDLRNHPRAYEVPKLAPPPSPPTPDYSRPTKNLNAVDRKGMPSGGFSLTTGKPT